VGSKEFFMHAFKPSMAPEFSQLLLKRERELCTVLERYQAGNEPAAPGAVSGFKHSAMKECLEFVGDIQTEDAAYELEQVLTARERLQLLTYGSCVECGIHIELRRLKVLPATPYCSRCQAAHENSEALARH